MQAPAGHRADYFWLVLILLLALALRLVGLNGPLWYDEILTVDTHLRLPFAQMMQGYDMNYHYLFNLQSKLAIVAFGEQNWAIRLPAMLFGLGAITAMWWLARDIAGAAMAHLTALLLALSYHHIWFSQNARGYTELAFWGTLGMIFFLRGWKRPRLLTWAGYGIVLALAVFTHLTGAFLFAAQGLMWLALVIVGSLRGSLLPGQFRLPLIGYLIGGVLTLLLYAPVLPSVLSAVGGVGGTSAVDVMKEYQSPFWSLLEGVRTALGSAGPVVGAVAIAILGLAAIGGWQSRRASPLFAPLTALHIALTLLLLLMLGMRIWPRFFFADIGFVMLLIVLGVRQVCRWIAQAASLEFRTVFLAAGAAMIAISGALAARNYMAPKQDLAGAYAYVESIRSPGVRVYAVGFPATVFEGHFGADWGAIRDNDAYRAAREEAGPMLLVVAFPARSLRKVSLLDADTGNTLKLVRKFRGTLGDGNVLIFRRGQ